MATRGVAVLTAVGLLTAGAAQADVIDGAWCRAPSQRLTIDGPRIVTPAGSATEGNYSRHYFSYVVPSGEAGAGTTVEMRLLNEETMQMRAGPGAPVETWHRCSPAVSWRTPEGTAGG
jgi:hypothetical protein